MVQPLTVEVFGLVKVAEEIGDGTRASLLLVKALEELGETLFEAGQLVSKDFGRGVHLLVEQPVVRRRKIRQKCFALLV